jgi:hypothetical protein
MLVGTEPGFVIRNEEWRRRPESLRARPSTGSGMMTALRASRRLT